MKQIWIVSGLVVAALGTSALIVGGRALFGDEPAPVTATQELPWQVTTLPGGGIQVLGLSVSPTLGTPAPDGSTLGDVKQRWGEAVQIAIVVVSVVPLAVEYLSARRKAGRESEAATDVPVK